MARIVKTTSLYTLIVRPDNSFEIKIDGDSIRNGTLLEDFTPAVNPEKEIDDPKDTKPEDWVDEARIPDPEAKKPEDWDEDAPFEIVDEEATMPEDWLVDEPTTIPDPEAEKPEDWDDEEDGDWVPPTVPNPKCDEVSGCGKWERPMIKNPAYKGKWSAPYIDNPAYKGEWKPRKIANPDYFEDKTPANFEPMGAVSFLLPRFAEFCTNLPQIGFEIWTMQNDILFDNIYIGHSAADAEKLREETFAPKVAAEKAEEEANAPKPEELPKALDDIVFKEDPVGFVKQRLTYFVDAARRDPVEAVKSAPEVAGALGLVVALFLTVLISALTGGAAPSKEQVKAQAQKAKETAVDAKNKAAEAVATGAEKAQAEVNKRQTRSSS